MAAASRPEAMRLITLPRRQERRTFLSGCYCDKPSHVIVRASWARCCVEQGGKSIRLPVSIPIPRAPLNEAR